MRQDSPLHPVSVILPCPPFTSTRLNTLSHTHTHTHTYTHTYREACVYTHRHTHSHTHTGEKGRERKKRNKRGSVRSFCRNPQGGEAEESGLCKAPRDNCIVMALYK